jgi:hypothetical protein
MAGFSLHYSLLFRKGGKGWGIREIQGTNATQQMQPSLQLNIAKTMVR